MLEAFNTEFWQDIVWALVHSIWQALIIALLLGCVLKTISAKRASLRYWISVAAMIAIPLSSFLTYHIGNEIQNYSSANMSIAGALTDVHELPQASMNGSITPGTFSANAVATSPTNWTAWVAVLWLAGTFTMVLRTISAVFRANKFAATEPIESSSHLQLLSQLSTQMGLRTLPSFWRSSIINSPYVIGILSPAIVVPLSMLTSLTTSELQAVLAHELAHIKRNDYLANLFQMVLESVYFFSPALWWISRQVRREREACCDQIAITAASSEVGYATILANWMETILSNEETPAPRPAMAFGDRQPSSMLERVQRILQPEHKPTLRVSPLNWLFVIAASLGAGYLLFAGSKAVATVAVHVLTDTERVAAIEEKQEALSILPSGPRGQTKIRGRILTEDGGEIERGGMYSTCRYDGGGSSGSVGSFEANEEFEISAKEGRFTLEFFSKNYAPAIVGPFDAKADETITQDIKLTKGETHTIHVVDEEGNPISGAKTKLHPGWPFKAQTNEEGLYVFQHRTPGQESSLSVTKYGYCDANRKVIDGGRTEVVLKKAPITKGIVISAEGKPVAGAELTVVQGTAGNHNQLYRDKAPIATTDENGRFETSGLSTTPIYKILVTSENSLTYFSDVLAGEDLSLKLNPACSLDVTIEGDLSLLRRFRGEPQIRIQQRGPGNLILHGSYFTKSMLEVVEDSDDRVKIRVKWLLPGKFSISSGKFNYEGTAKPGNHSLVIDAKEKPSVDPELAELRLRFQCDGKTVQPSGNLSIDGTFYPIQDGELITKLTFERHHLDPLGLIGFSFENQHIEVDTDTEVTIEVEPAGAVSGRIVDANGDPIECHISGKYELRTPEAYISSDLNNTFHSDTDGEFLLTPLPFGAKVTVTAGKRFNPAISEPVVVTKENPIPEIELKTAKPLKAKVRVVDENGLPIRDADLSVLAIGGLGSWGGSMITNENGEYELAPLHPTWNYEVSAQKKGFVHGGTKLPQGETATLVLKKSDIIRGQVLDSKGTPLKGKVAWATPVDPSSYPQRHQHVRTDEFQTDTEGRFQFSSLPNGEFYIRAGSAEVIVNVGVDKGPVILRLKEPRPVSND